MVWFKISGFCDPINTGSSLVLLPVILLLSWVMKICSFGSAGPAFHVPQPFADDRDVGWANSESCIWAWMADRLVSPLALPYLHHQGKLSNTALARAPNAAISRRLSCPWDGLTHTHASRDSSTVLPSQSVGPTLSSTAVCEGSALLPSQPWG